VAKLVEELHDLGNEIAIIDSTNDNDTNLSTI